MKRVFCLLLAAAMLLSGLSAMAETVETDAASHAVEMRDVPLIINGRINPNVSIRLWFLDGVEDLPYVELKGFTDDLNKWLSDSGTDFTWEEDKASGLVTLLGDTSGGGSCEVFPMTTAWGASITISGYKRLSFIKNGSFYDIDRGIEPDVVFTKIQTFYDREKVTEIINNLY